MLLAGMTLALGGVATAMVVVGSGGELPRIGIAMVMIGNLLGFVAGLPLGAFIAEDHHGLPTLTVRRTAYPLGVPPFVVFAPSRWRFIWTTAGHRASTAWLVPAAAVSSVAGFAGIAAALNLFVL